MSDSVQPHRRQPTRLPHPWDSPGKNTGVGCHFLLECMKVKSESKVAQSCPTLGHSADPMDCSPSGSSVHGIFQARVLEWGAIDFSELACSLVEIRPASYADGLCITKAASWPLPTAELCNSAALLSFVSDCSAVFTYRLYKCGLL